MMKHSVSLAQEKSLRDVVMAASTEGGGSCITSTFECEGVTHSVTTCQKPGESVEDWLARHLAAVEKAMEDCEAGE